LVDRDYHSPEYVDAMITNMKTAGLECLVWERKELESYLLVPSALARVSGCSIHEIDALLAGITQNMYEDVLFQHMATAKQDFPEKRRLADQTIGKDFRWLKEAWKDPGARLWRCPPKDVLSELNGALQNRGKQAISVERLASSLRADDVPDEMKKVIHRVEKRLAATHRIPVG